MGHVMVQNARGITADDLIDGTTIVAAASAVELMVNGAQTLSY